jgi:hypothetical protein
MASTPTIAPGQEPIAIHSASPMSTVPLRRCRQPPSVLVMAP